MTERYVAIALVLATLTSIGGLCAYKWRTTCHDCPTITAEQYLQELNRRVK